MDSYSVDWTSSRVKLWRKVLAKYIGRPAVAALEIGTFEGRTAVWFLGEILTGDGAQLTCVDPWATNAGEAVFDANTCKYGGRVRKVKELSLQFLSREVSQSFTEQYDFIYIDGDHHAANCLTDAALAWRLLKRGGVLAFDDCGADFTIRYQGKFPVPRVAADAFLRCFASDCKLLHDGDQVVVEKRS